MAMGMKRSGKRLLKLGQKAARELGKDGKAWVEKVFQTAYDLIEEHSARRRSRRASARRA
jgi:hypothetical protein